MRLIDADALKEDLENSKYIFGANKTIEFIQNSEIDRAISFIEDAPTVLIDEMKPLFHKLIDIMPELVSAITDALPNIVNSRIKCRDCGYYQKPAGEWIDDVCSCCGMESEYQTLYCGGCGVFMKNGFPSCGYGEARKGGEAK